MFSCAALLFCPVSRELKRFWGNAPQMGCDLLLNCAILLQTLDRVQSKVHNLATVSCDCSIAGVEIISTTTKWN